MSTTEFLKAIFNRLKRFKILILIIGLSFASLLLIYSLIKKPLYTAEATLFPLTTAPENSLSSSALSGLLGLADGGGKSFSSEAAINIIELTLSRNVREAVAITKMPAYGNKTVTEVLIEEANKNKWFFAKKLKLPTDSFNIGMTGGIMLKPKLAAKMSKNGVLILNFSYTNKELLEPITNIFIEKISQFYIELKRQKALADYNFTVSKIDSLQGIVSAMDNREIRLQNTTMFTPNMLQYNLPKTNLSEEKSRIARQRDMAIGNRDEALWRLQKVTPIISILDKPTPPYETTKPSPVVLTLIGFMIGCILGSFLFIYKLIYQFVKSEVYKSIFGSGETPAA